MKRIIALSLLTALLVMSIATIGGAETQNDYDAQPCHDLAMASLRAAVTAESVDAQELAFGRARAYGALAEAHEVCA